MSINQTNLSLAATITTTAAPFLSKVIEGSFLSGRNPFEFNPIAPLPTFIIQLLIIISMSRLVKFLLSPIRQPSVIAEIISGIILGPTVFGHIPSYTLTIFPKPSLPFLNLMSNFGLVIFLFLVGLELDPKMLKNSIKQSLSISLAGMLLPFGLGAAASYALYSYVEPVNTKVAFMKYFLFLGVAMSITAFPVLARILTELNLLRTKVGSITIAAAAVDDATSWCLLALVISLINAKSGLTALYVFLMGLGYSLFVLFGVRPVYVWILRRSGAFQKEPSQAIMCLTLLLVYTSAFLTDAVGIHAIFGGFLIGIMIPHDQGLAYKITHKLEDIISVVFLPLYFALSGLKTQIGSLNDMVSWGCVLLVIFVACAGKIVGCATAARISGLSFRESITVGFLMNCKGLVELIVLNLGYDMGIISQKTFAIMVIMALFTTFLTVPFVSVIYPQKFHDVPGDGDGGIMETISSTATLQDSLQGGSRRTKINSNLLVCVNDTEHVPSVLRMIELMVSAQFESPTGLEKIGKKASMSSLLDFVPAVLKPEHHSKKEVAVSALRLIEITERDSSVMIQTSPDALRQDPVMKMMEAFGKVTSMDIRGLVSVVTASNFVNCTTQTGSRIGARFILVPWAGNTEVERDNLGSGRRESLASRRRSVAYTTSSYVRFFQDLLSVRIPPSILILVDRAEKLVRGETSTQGVSVNGLVAPFSQIYALLFGGADDRHALKIILAIAQGQPGKKLNIIRFSKSPHTPNLPPDQGNVKAGNLSPKSGNEISIERRTDGGQEFPELDPTTMESWKNVTYTEIETNNPIPRAVECVKDLDSHSLVLVGRTQDNFVGGPVAAVLKNPDQERRKVLGDVAEAILLSPATPTILIVHAGTKARK